MCLQLQTQFKEKLLENMIKVHVSAGFSARDKKAIQSVISKRCKRQRACS